MLEWTVTNIVCSCRGDLRPHGAVGMRQDNPAERPCLSSYRSSECGRQRPRQRVQAYPSTVPTDDVLRGAGGRIDRVPDSKGDTNLCLAAGQLRVGYPERSRDPASASATCD